MARPGRPRLGSGRCSPVFPAARSSCRDPRRHRRAARSLRVPMRTSEDEMKDFPIAHRKVQANGIELHLAESGDSNAPLLILLHGFPEFWFAWRDYMSSLAA